MCAQRSAYTDLATMRGDLARAATTAQADGQAVRGEFAAFRGDVRADLARLNTRGERLDATVKAQPNAIMLRLGALLVVLTGIILAALRYLPPPHS